MQEQIQALITGGGGVAVVTTNTEAAWPQVFDRTLSNVSGFVTTCRLYLRMKMRGVAVEEQIQ